MAEEEEEFSSAEDSMDVARHGPTHGGRDLDDDFEEYPESPPATAGQTAGALANQPFDEAHDLSGAESSPDPHGGGSRPAAAAVSKDTVQNQHFDEAVDLSSDDGGEAPRAGHNPGSFGGGGAKESQGSLGRRPAEQAAPAPNPPPENLAPLPSSATNFADAAGSVRRNFAPRGADGDVSAAEESPTRGVEAGPAEGMYDPAEYEGLGVSQEISELFQYIARYKPHNIELETKMKPFIPDYIPAVGEIDPFVKVPRPDSKPDQLGLVTLDEPAANQSDPTVFTLQLRAVTKSSGAQPMLVRQVELAEKNPKMITNWIQSINDLHRHKPPPSVRYTKPMPDIEALMQIWPAKFEELLETTRLPDGEMAVELPELVRLMCGILDIPIYASLTESLHVMFTLYSDFKANVHFQQQLADEAGGGGGGGGFGGDGGGFDDGGMQHAMG